jgi:hypothetical protein
VKELRLFSFEGVADELENPSEYEQAGGVGPQSVKENADHKDWERKKNSGNAQRVADTVDRVLMAGRILRDPLLAGAVTQHLPGMIHRLATDLGGFSRIHPGRLSAIFDRCFLVEPSHAPVVAS